MIIILPHGEIKKLAEDMQKSMPTIRKALRGETKSKIAEAIRKVAIERGGRVYYDEKE